MEADKPKDEELTEEPYVPAAEAESLQELLARADDRTKDALGEVILMMERSRQ